MFDEFIPMPKMTQEQIELYAERIGYKGSLEPTKEVLDELIWHHQLSVPFETIDCHDLKIGVDIHPEAVFDKLVRRHRGGHCLETNGCFFRLLISLGFDARPCLCRVLLGTDEFTHPIDHRTALVNLDGHTYYCDVGVGGPMPPAGLDIGTQEWQNLRADCYAVRPSDEFGWYYICRKTPYGNHDAGTPDAMRIEAMFSPVHCFETDFVFLNQYMSFHPEALHVAHRIVNIRTEKGYKLIDDEIYRELQDDEVIEEFPVTDCLRKTLKDKFNIDVQV